LQQFDDYSFHTMIQTCVSDSLADSTSRVGADEPISAAATAPTIAAVIALTVATLPARSSSWRQYRRSESERKQHTCKSKSSPVASFGLGAATRVPSPPLGEARSRTSPLNWRHYRADIRKETEGSEQQHCPQCQHGVASIKGQISGAERATTFQPEKGAAESPCFDAERPTSPRDRAVNPRTKSYRRGGYSLEGSYGGSQGGAWPSILLDYYPL
jgi:hypothetical protein